MTFKETHLSVYLVEVLVGAVQPGGVVGHHLERADVPLDLAVLLHHLLHPLLLRLGDLHILERDVHPQLVSAVVQEVAQVRHIPAGKELCKLKGFSTDCASLRGAPPDVPGCPLRD